MFQESFKGVSRTIKGVSMDGVFSGFQGCLKEVQWVFEEEFQKCFKEVLRVFQGRVRGVPIDLQG